MSLALLGLPLGFILLYYSSNWLVDSAKRTALLLGVSPFVIGLTIVAFGSSSPEAAIALMARTSPDVVLGNIVGSNIANIGLVIGLTAIIYPLATRFDTVKFEAWVMLAAALLLTLMAASGAFDILEGVLLLALMTAFLLVVYRLSKKDPLREVVDETLIYEDPGRLAPNLAVLVVSLALLVLGAQVFVLGAVELADALQLPELVIGLVVVAIGTSLPELSISLAAAWKRETEIVLSNIIGSNIFNALFVMGLAAISATIVVPAAMLRMDLLVMLGLSLILLLLMRLRGGISRRGGLVFAFIYFAYLLLLFV